MSLSVPLPGLAVSVRSTDDRAVVRVAGELDLSTVDQLADATGALRADARRLEFDLGGLAFIDLTGLRFFLALHEAAERGELAFTLRRPSHEVLRAFATAGLDAVMPWSARPSKRAGCSVPAVDRQPARSRGRRCGVR